MASRATVVAATDYSDLDFLVFTRSGPESDIPRVPAEVSDAASPDVPLLLLYFACLSKYHQDQTC